MITPVSNGICPVLPHSSYRPPNSTIPPFIGNFMLSSCPGKKVRMNGEALKGGRGAICRDVKLDLQRAKDEGVRMVVCCLDDSGASFDSLFFASCTTTDWLFCQYSQNSLISVRLSRSTQQPVPNSNFKSSESPWSKVSHRLLPPRSTLN